MKDDLQNQLYDNLAAKGTDELLDIWQNGDATEWEAGVFDVVKRLLKERLGRLPTQSVETRVAQMLARVDEYLEGDDLEKALKECESAIRLEPNLPSAYNYRGQVREEMGQLELAIADYRRATELDPEWPEPWTNMRVVEKELEGQYAESAAKEHLKEAFAYAWTNEPEAALQECELALPDLPRIARAYTDVGDIFSELYQLETAWGWYREALRLNPRFRVARENMHKVVQELKEEQFRRAASQRPGALEEARNTIPEPWQLEATEELRPVPEWVYMDEASYLLAGWPGHRTRQGRTGYDPLDTDFENARMEGVMLRMLFTLKFRTRNPFYLFMMVCGAALFCFSLPLVALGLLGGEIGLSLSVLVLTSLYWVPGIAMLVNVFASLGLTKSDLAKQKGRTFF